MNGGISAKSNNAVMSIAMGLITAGIIAIIVVVIQLVRIPSKIEDTRNANGTVSHCAHYDDQKAPVVVCEVVQP